MTLKMLTNIREETKPSISSTEFPELDLFCIFILTHNCLVVLICITQTSKLRLLVNPFLYLQCLYDFYIVDLLFQYQNGVLYRGVSPDVLMFDQTGYLQVGGGFIYFCACLLVRVVFPFLISKCVLLHVLYLSLL